MTDLINFKIVCIFLDYLSRAYGPMLSTRYQCFYVTDCIYPPAIGIIKISTLLLFARVFQSRSFIRILWAVGLFISTYTLIVMLLIIFECKSIKGFWDSNLEAGCMSDTKVLIAMESLNVTTDFLVVCLPLPLLWRLQMPRGMKLQLIGIFSVGSLSVAQHLLGPFSTKRSN